MTIVNGSTTEPADAPDGRKLSTPWIRTPLVHSQKLSKIAGCQVYLKLENLQPSGSFKSRGIGNLILSTILAHPPRSPLHFFISSGGNAGLASVHASILLGYPCTVVVPMSCKEFMIEKLRLAGATDVIQHGASWREADDHLRSQVITTAEAKGEIGVYIPPFDHEKVWEGAEGIVVETEEQLGTITNPGSTTGTGNRVAADLIICSVGGGGLYSGIQQGVEKGVSAARPGGESAIPTQVVAVETKGADSLSASVLAGEHITLSGITSQATSLGAVRICDQAYHFALQPNSHSLVVDDADAARACWRFADDERLLVELACGAALAPVYGGEVQKIVRDVTEEKGISAEDVKVVVVVCGGVNVSVGMVEGWRQEYP